MCKYEDLYGFYISLEDKLTYVINPSEDCVESDILVRSNNFYIGNPKN